MIAWLSGFLLGFVTAKVPASWREFLWGLTKEGAGKLKDRIAKLRSMRGG